ANNPNEVIGGSGPGEGNIIAFNGGAGVSVSNSGTRVEGNSIHHNGRAGVEVWDYPITAAQIVGNSIHANDGPGVWVHGRFLDFVWDQRHGGGPYIPTGIRVQRYSIYGNVG